MSHVNARSLCSYEVAENGDVYVTIPQGIPYDPLHHNGRHIIPARCIRDRDTEWLVACISGIVADAYTAGVFVGRRMKK